MNKKLLAAALFLVIKSATGLEVMYWCDQYGIGQDLNYHTSIPLFKETLTAVALQWWQPSSDGSTANLVVSADNVTTYVNHYHGFGVKVFLTVYNCSDHWDWNWAMAAYKTNKDKFIKSLVSQCEQYDLDGVDIDFEGGTQTGGGTELQLEREPFTEFVKELGTQLHQAGRELSICSFHSPCWNAPNMAWWPDWVGYVDHARLMGYWDDYEASERELLDEGTCWGLPTETKPTRYFKYSWKSEWGLSCGFDSTVVSIGMPSENGMDNWGGQGCQAHIQDNLNLPSPMGVCIWESELAGAWKDARTWELLKQVRDINPPHSNVTRVKEPQNPANHIAGEVSIIKNSLMITVPHTGRFTVSIYDLSGKRILNMEVVRLAKGKNRLNAGMGEKAPGIYVCKVRGKDLLLTNTINTN